MLRILVVWLINTAALAVGGRSLTAVYSGTASFSGGTVTGTAEFTQVGTDVTINVTLNGCVDTKAYPIHIHAGASQPHSRA